MIFKKKWKRYYFNENLSTYVTIVDEVFAMLVLENYASDLVHDDDEWRRNVCFGKSQSSTKYTKNINLGIQTKAGRMKG